MFTKIRSEPISLSRGRASLGQAQDLSAPAPPGFCLWFCLSMNKSELETEEDMMLLLKEPVHK